MSSERKLAGCGFGGHGGMIGEGKMDGLGPRGSLSRILHGLEGLHESGMAEIRLAVMTVDSI